VALARTRLSLSLKTCGPRQRAMIIYAILRKNLAR